MHDQEADSEFSLVILRYQHHYYRTSHLDEKVLS